MYIDVGLLPSDTATLNFAFTGTSNNRIWEIKVSQIPCYGACSKDYQWVELNWSKSSCFKRYCAFQTSRWVSPIPHGSDWSVHHLQLLAHQRQPLGWPRVMIQSVDDSVFDKVIFCFSYSVCIRQEKGYCCVQYMPCADDNSFSLDTEGMMAEMGKALTDSSCTRDFIAISGSNGACNQGGSRLPIVSKYCGQYLNAAAMAMANGVICDCTQPFIVDVFTDALDDTAMGPMMTMPNMAPSRGNLLKYFQRWLSTSSLLQIGVCLTWTQIPCT